MMTQSFPYDVFLSHSSKDKEVVRELAERLKNDGLRVWFDEWVIHPGDAIPLAVEAGLESSRTLVLAMSQNAFASDWVAMERHTVLFRDPTNRQRRFIPLRLDDSEIKETIRQFAYVDWRNKDLKEYERLRNACLRRDTSSDPLMPHPTARIATRVLHGHSAAVTRLQMMPGTVHALSISPDNTIRKWDIDSGECIAVLQCNHPSRTINARHAAFSRDGCWAIIYCNENALVAWDIAQACYAGTYWGVEGRIRDLVVASNQQFVVAAGETTIQVWRGFGHFGTSIPSGSNEVTCIALSQSDDFIFAGYSDGVVRKWSLDGCRVGECRCGAGITAITPCPNGTHLVCGSQDTSLQMLDATTLHHMATLEGHTGIPTSASVTADSCWAVSVARDNTLRMWDLLSGRCIGVLEANTGVRSFVASSSDASRVICGGEDSAIRCWEIPSLQDFGAKLSPIVRYSNAEVILIGNTGVGKSGLAVRLTEDRFVPTPSTDAHWATQLKVPHDTSSDTVDREIWLWDFAGQSDYRLIHQLFMDQTAVAVLVFNPQDNDLLDSLSEWDRYLERVGRRRLAKLLVAGRCDVGRLKLSRQTLDKFMCSRSYCRYLDSSAKTGEGCDEVREEIVRQIDWGSIPWTASPRIFKLLKDEILQLRSEGVVLLRMAELKQQLEMRLLGKRTQPSTDGDEGPDILAQSSAFTLEELRAVVALLDGPGIVWRLSFGDFVLLEPERINAYAAAVIRHVGRRADGIACIPEEDVLSGRLDYQGMRRLPASAETIVLRAMHQAFVDHGICIREHTDAGTQLVFPSYVIREPPDEFLCPPALVHYQFSGRIDDIYATLVVGLCHTRAFEADRLWRDVAQFRTVDGDRMWASMTRRKDGTAEITIHFDGNVGNDSKVIFMKYIHEHLLARAQEVTRTRRYVCPHCGHPVRDDEMVRELLESERKPEDKSILCVRCERRVPLWDQIEERFASSGLQRRVRRMETAATLTIDEQSRELILLGHSYSIASETGQRFLHTPKTHWGVDGEIVLKNLMGDECEKRIFLQLKWPEWYASAEDETGDAVFVPREACFAEWWRNCVYPVMLVVRMPDGDICWMDIRRKLETRMVFLQDFKDPILGRAMRQHTREEMPIGRPLPTNDELHGGSSGKAVPSSVTTLKFDGTPFTALSLQRLREAQF